MPNDQKYMLYTLEIDNTISTGTSKKSWINVNTTLFLISAIWMVKMSTKLAVFDSQF